MIDKKQNSNAWVIKANEDLAAAKQLMTVNSFYFASSIIFHFNQAAEKFLVALWVSLNQHLPDNYMLGDLLTQLPVGIRSSINHKVIASLEPYDRLVRYPSDLRLPTENEICEFKDALDDLKILIEKELVFTSNVSYTGLSDNSYLFLRDFIEGNPSVYTYLHNTDSMETVNAIMEKGLLFKGYLEYTAEPVSGIDNVELRYFIQKRHSYGRYTLIIQIGKEILDKYSLLLKGSKHNYAEVLSVQQSLDTDENENIYCLPSIFIKGFVNLSSGLSSKNIAFNPNMDLPVFNDNLNNLLKEVK